ncbi:UTRA domain-containing protein [Streptomyces prunicolor]|uniref:UTRA domain-containing protein n=1 Tax=Streptomyces prunicolor TaxID=67348 RepID=UPI00341CDBBC
MFVRDFKPIRRRGLERLAHARWGEGRSIWATDAGDRELVVESVEVGEEDLVSGTAVARPDTGPGGIYARLEELGRKSVHFGEEVRSRMPSGDEAERRALPTGGPVMLIARTAFDAAGVAVEVNNMVLDSSAYVLEFAFDA